MKIPFCKYLPMPWCVDVEGEGRGDMGEEGGRERGEER